MTNTLATVGLAAGLVLAGVGCHKEASANAAATDLERSFQVKAPAAATAPTPEAAPTAAVPGDEVKQAVTHAVVAIRTNGYAEAFMTLHAVQASPHITVNQYSAIQNARLAVEREVAAKAAAGDPAALKELSRIKQSGH